MQMGRWFGFRRGYGDLVRLFIGRNVPAPGGQHVDLYEAFEAVVRDEEDFRAELEQYAAINEETGHPQITPEDVPPMVFQQVPWLKPTAGNKMYNAELSVKESAASSSTSRSNPTRDGGQQQRTDTFEQFSRFSTSSTRRRSSNIAIPRPGRSARFDGTVWHRPPHRQCATRLHSFNWAPNWSFAPTLAFVDEIIKKGQLDDFAVLLPDLEGAVARDVGQRPGKLPILRRRRRLDRPGFPGSSKRQRDAIETIAGKRIPVQGLDILDGSGGPLAASLHTPTRAGLLLTFALDMADRDAQPANLPPGPVAAARRRHVVFLGVALCCGAGRSDRVPHAKIRRRSNY